MRHHHVGTAQLAAPGNLLEHVAPGVQHELQVKAGRSETGRAGARPDLADIGEPRMEARLAIADAIQQILPARYLRAGEPKEKTASPSSFDRVKGGTMRSTIPSSRLDMSRYASGTAPSANASSR